MITTLDTIVDLRAYTGYADEEIVYVKGYYQPGDGGGSHFIYKANGKNTQYDSVDADNGGTIIVPDTPTGNGRWFRQYEGYLNALFFGVVKDLHPTETASSPYYPFSNTDRIQAAIDYAATYTYFNKKSGGMTLYFPNGVYFIDKQIVLKSKINPVDFTDGVRLLGGQATLFMAGDVAFDYMFRLEDGPVDRFHMENFILDLQNTDNSGGLHLRADRNSTGIGGLWASSFKNIKILHSQGHGILIEGGEGSDVDPESPPSPFYPYEMPNQFLIFENIRIVREKEEAACLFITGQLNTTTFLNCSFEVPFLYTPEGALGGVNVIIDSFDTNVNTAVVSFINCNTGGFVEYGFKISNTHNVTFDDCWFENIDISIDLQNCTGINIHNNRFANAGGMGSYESFIDPMVGYGRCISVQNSSVTIENNYVTVTDPSEPSVLEKRFITGIGNNNVINASNNSFQDIRLSSSIGTVQSVCITDIETFIYDPMAIPPPPDTIKGIETLGKKVVFVPIYSNSSITCSSENGDEIYRINATIAAGETLFIRADQGSLTFYEWNPIGEFDGKNINLNGRGTLTLTNGQAAVFIKLDGINGYEKCCYQLVSVCD